MENELFTIGLVIADKDEYVHLDKLLTDDAVRCDINGLMSHSVTLDANGKKIKIRTICTGIGKVCATAGAAFLAPLCDVLISTGLSGGFGTVKNDIVLGTDFLEHDFDLTAIGYELSKKPGQENVICSTNELNADLLNKYPFVKSGVFVTGDSFIASKEKHDFLVESFDPVACDMESAAVGYVAKLFELPFMSVRLVSDTADDDSSEIYTDTLHKTKSTEDLFSLIFDWIKSL